MLTLHVINLCVVNIKNMMRATLCFLDNLSFMETALVFWRISSLESHCCCWWNTKCFLEQILTECKNRSFFLLNNIEHHVPSVALYCDDLLKKTTVSSCFESRQLLMDITSAFMEMQHWEVTDHFDGLTICVTIQPPTDWLCKYEGFFLEQQYVCHNTTQYIWCLPHRLHYID